MIVYDLIGEVFITSLEMIVYYLTRDEWPD